MIEITTNNKPRDLITYVDLTPQEQNEFDYIDREEWWDSRFFRYRGNVYDAFEFQRVEPGTAAGEMTTWEGFQPDSWFSGTVIRFVSDYEQVVVGRWVH